MGLIIFFRNRQNEQKYKLAKKTILISLIIFLFIVIANATIYVYRDIKARQLNWSEYYKKVAKRCNLSWHYQNCISSVEEMEEKNWLYPFGGKCPDGYIQLGSCMGCLTTCAQLTKPKEINNLDDCFNLEEIKSIIEPIVKSNIPGHETKETDRSIERQDNCIIEYIKKHEEVIDKKTCEKISYNHNKASCLQNIAINSRNPSLCTAKFIGDQSYVYGCYSSLANRLNDISLCYKTSRSNDCIGHYAVFTNNVDLCEQASRRDWCLHMIAEEILDPSICPKINLDFRREACYELIKESNEK